MMRKLSVPVLVACGLAACSGGDDVAPPPTVTTATTVAVVAPAVLDLSAMYFESLAAGVGAQSPAVTAALPGSEAALFAEHQAAVRAVLGLGAARTVIARDQGVEVCETDGVCSVYDAVTTDAATGRVIDFSIDGVALTGRIVGGGPVADRGGVVARVRSASESASGDLLVLLEVDNTTDGAVELFGFAAVYAPVDASSGAPGDSVEATGAWGAQTVPVGLGTNLLVEFPPSRLGGQLRLSGLRSDGLDLALDVRVPTP